MSEQPKFRKWLGDYHAPHKIISLDQDASVEDLLYVIEQMGQERKAMVDAARDAIQTRYRK